MAQFEPYSISIVNPFEALYPIFIDTSCFCDNVEQFLVYADTHSMCVSLLCEISKLIYCLTDFSQDEAALVEKFNVLVDLKNFDKKQKQIKINSLQELKK